MTDPNRLPPPLPPLDYSNLGSESLTSRQKWRRFWLALLGGGAVSAIFWIAGWTALEKLQYAPAVVAIVPAAKFLVGLPMMFNPRRKPIGIGLLVSIPLGALIFFGSCLANIKLDFK